MGGSDFISELIFLGLWRIYKKQNIGQNQQSNMKTCDGGLLKDLQLKNMNATFLSLYT